MSNKTLSNPGRRCQLILQQCLAIQLSKLGHTPDDFWMYDSGYIVFQNFLAANTQCWWNPPLSAATRALKYAGHVAPGVLLVTAEPCALEILRGAYARSVLKPPATYVISSLGDIDDCIVTPTLQGQFTPLPEAICNVIMDLTTEGQSATIENVRKQLSITFPHMSLPATEVIYDTLAQLMQEQKIYQTSKGYFIFTPEKRRSRSRTRSIGGTRNDCRELAEYSADYIVCPDTPTQRSMLMTNVDALRSFFGEISTERDGDMTHQCIQTNLTDVICGGNPNDKILYPRVQKRRSSSFSSSRSLDRKHSFRFFSSSSKRLQRFSSTRSLSKTYVQSLTTDSSSSELQSTDSSTRKKGSLLSRLFRRRSRNKNERLKTFSSQFPPSDWFNSRTVHLHSVGTQTTTDDIPSPDTQSNSTFYDVADVKSQYSPSTISRRRSRRHLSSESTFLLSSRDCSPVRRRSPATISSHSIQYQTQRDEKKLNSKSSDKKQTTKSATLKENNTLPQQQITHFDCDESYLQCSPNSSLNMRSYLRSSLPVRRSTAKLQTRQQDTPSPSLSPSPTPSRFNRGTFSSCGSSSLSSRSDRNHSSKTLPNSNNSSSITLQVTASNNGDKLEPNTKIYVQNTPTHNMITFENEKLLNEANVYLINKESITNKHGELLRKTISTQNHQLQQQQRERQAVSYWQQQHEHKPIPKEVKKEENISIYNNNLNKLNNNIVTTMNNNRRLSMPQTITSATGVHYGSTQLIYKNNVLKEHEQQPTMQINEPQQSQQQQEEQPQHKINDLVVGNLGFYEKNNYQMLSNNTLCETKNLRNNHNNNHNNNIINNNNNHIICSSDNLAQIFLHKQMMESEPNLLAFKDNKPLQQQQQQQNQQQQQQKNTYLGKENGFNSNDEIRCSFPTLTDISFNFTSLAAQKILQAVSLNSIDTLVELKQFQQRKDAAAEFQEETTQPQQKTTTTTSTTKAICTDYGLL